MDRAELASQSEHYLRDLLTALLPAQTPVHLFGSRARMDGRWNSDYDIWIDADIDSVTLGKIENAIEESFIPFHVDIVTTRQLKGNFGSMVKKDAIKWM